MLEQYNQKRDFNKTTEPKGTTKSSGKQLCFVVQHHMARREHYDLRLEWKGVLLSWAIPKGPSFNAADKRLAIHVEDHPLDYRNFEGTIPKGEYGGGTVMIWDEGYWEPLTDADEAVSGKTSLKFVLHGKRLRGKWVLIKTKNSDDQWLLIKEKDEWSQRTMNEVENGLEVKISSPDKVLFASSGITKLDVVQYYQQIAAQMLPYIRGRRLSLVVCPQGTQKPCFYKKNKNAAEGLGRGLNSGAGDKDVGKELASRAGNGSSVLDPITGIHDLLVHVQNNTLEFHTWGSTIKNPDNPDIMVFDLDPDEGMDLAQVRRGVKDIKSVLDELRLVSFLKTSGNKGYHIVVPIAPRSDDISQRSCAIKAVADWDAVSTFAKNIAIVMEKKWPDLYTSNVRKINRKGKIFIDWIRNGKGATSIVPYSVRAKEGTGVSMPITWRELDTIAPNGISMDDALKRVKSTDPWKDFWDVQKNQWIT